MKKILTAVAIVIPLLAAIGVGVYYYLQLPNSTKLTKYNELITLAESHVSKKEYATAIASYNEAAALVNSEPKAFEGIVDILLLKNQLGQVTEILDKSVSNLEPNKQAELNLKLGDAYLRLDNAEYAKRYIQKARDLDSANESAKISMAKVLLKEGSHAKALEQLDIPSDSTNYSLAYTLKLFATYNDITALKTLLDEGVTVADTEKLIVDDFKVVGKQEATDDIYIAALLSRIYINNGYPKLALALLEPMKEKIAEYPDGMYLLARAYYDVENYTSCITTLKDFPSSTVRADVSWLFARSYVKTKDQTQSEKYYTSAISAAGDNGEEVTKEYARYLLDLEQYTKAKDVLDSAKKRFKEVWVDIMLMELHYAQKSASKFVYYMGEVTKKTTLTDEEKKEYLVIAITYYIEDQKYSDATVLLSQLLTIDEYNPWYYYLEGKMYLQNTDTAQAKTNLEKAIDLDIEGTVTESAKKLLSRIN